MKEWIAVEDIKNYFTDIDETHYHKNEILKIIDKLIDEYKVIAKRGYRKDIRSHIVKKMRRKAFENWQEDRNMHNLTCDECGESLKMTDETLLKCTKCGYEQRFIPDIVFEKYILDENKDMVMRCFDE